MFGLNVKFLDHSISLNISILANILLCMILSNNMLFEIILTKCSLSIDLVSMALDDWLIGIMIVPLLLVVYIKDGRSIKIDL